MASLTHRSVTIERTSLGRYVAHNGRGGRLEFGTGDTPDFTPVDLLLAAIGGCSGADVDYVTTRRSEPDRFTVSVTAEKAKDDGNYLKDVVMTFTLTFPEGEAGDAARDVLPDIVQRSHDRLCTVSRTVERETPIEVHITDPVTARS